MAYFPFFIDMEGKSGLIVGGGRVAAHKVHKLLPFGAALTVVAPKIDTELLENPALICLEREFRDSDTEGKLFVIAATADPSLNARISALCQERGILVNVVDDKEKCGFLFPSLVKEGDLTVGISTGGASPQVAATLRSRIAGELPSQMDGILEYLAQIRESSKERIADEGGRRAFLKETALLCMEKNRPLTPKETGERMERYTRKAVGTDGKNGGRIKPGRVTLVGAGCGPQDLITVRGLNAIRGAQVLVYDDLADPRLLEHAAESCEKLYVGKRKGAHSLGQEEINRLLVEKAREGKSVVRLKGGDPFVFGRGGEELLALKAAGIEASEIPGITSAVAIPAAAGIPVTHRGISNSFHVMTGHTADSEDGLPEELAAMAQHGGTGICLMGLSHLEQIAAKLMEHGMGSDTPVAVIHGGFDGRTQTVRGTLDNIAHRVREAALETPAVIVTGKVAEMELTGGN